MKASRKVIRQMAKSYSPKAKSSTTKTYAAGAPPATVAKTVLMKRMRGKKKP